MIKKTLAGQTMAFPLFTFGGMFYWVDRHSYAGWRIQESIWLRRCRLLDPFNVRRASGSFELCYDMMLYFLRAWEVPQPPTEAAVVIHGLFQRPAGYEAMIRGLKKNFEPIFFSYPMLRFDLMKSARALNAVLDRRRDVSRFHFVAVGYGGLILRQAVAMNPPWLKKTGRTVFIAVPNQGCGLAEKYHEKWWYSRLLGQAGDAVLPKTVSLLPPVNGDFAVISGGRDDGKGYFSKINGDNDGILSVAETKLNGAKEDYLVMDSSHFSLHRNERVISMTDSFLATGRLGRRQRIRKEQSYTNLWDN